MLGRQTPSILGGADFELAEKQILSIYDQPKKV